MLDKQKATRCYQYEISKIRDRQTQEVRGLTEHLRKNGILSQGFGYEAYINLSAKHLKDCAELHVDCDLKAFERNKKIDDDTKTDLLNRMEKFIDALVSGYTSLIKEKVAANNLVGAIADAYLNAMYHKSLFVRQDLRNKILIKIDEHNDAIEVELGRAKEKMDT